MSQSNTKQPIHVRPIDPDVQQRRASDPAMSVWVTASAGSGKTKVLTDRVLRLLLPREDGQTGSKPYRILCLTFTKAAAKEMALRISKTLAAWAVMPIEGSGAEKGLRRSLEELLGAPPSEGVLKAARRLFTEIMEAPGGGLNIMTIHSFCQSVLARFPLEAGVPLNFTPLEEAEAEALLKQACQRVLGALETMPGSPLAQSAETVLSVVQEEALLALMKAFVKERGQFDDFLQQNFGLDGIRQAVFRIFDFVPEQTRQDFLETLCSANPDDALRQAAMMLQGGEKSADVGRAIAAWLEADVAARAKTLSAYLDCFFTKELPPKIRSQNFPPKPVAEKYPECRDVLLAEAERLAALTARLKNWDCADLTSHLLLLGGHVLKAYEEVKKAQAALDFDDLIFKTLALLQQNDMAGWVQYKLDQGLEHILVDEAQDTNPEQWRIIEALCRPFFEGAGAHERPRTTFTVGDEKQSIYSFQRASPQAFFRMQDHFAVSSQQGGLPWTGDVALDVSFRSAACILELVDSIFDHGQGGAPLSKLPVQHHSYRRGQAGRVEIWPLITPPEKRGIDFWAPPIAVESALSPRAALAEKIAFTLSEMIGKDILPSRGRPVQPGDVLILLRTRGKDKNNFVQHISKALKKYGIPVGGADRMKLTDHIAVQDIIALAAFCLCPVDDLSLAAFLKSPWLGLDEETLFMLCHGREASLWKSLREQAEDNMRLKAAADYLEGMLKAARSCGPFDFIMKVLYAACPADPAGTGLRAALARLGEDALDPLNEMLQQALAFERTEHPTLQHFIDMLAQQSSEIKREGSEAAAHVRIMTVHGAKGLQAPIVILPDTLNGHQGRSGKPDSKLLWPDKTGLPIPLWAPRKTHECGLYASAKTALDQQERAEQSRLLYVALTRAEDRLYIAGCQTTKQPDPESWYFKILEGAKRVPYARALDGEGVVFDTPQTADPDRIDKAEHVKAGPPPAMPAWLFAAAAQEAHARIIEPSRQAAEKLDRRRPLSFAAREDMSFLRGNITHRLLQILPDMPVEKRAAAAHHFAAQYGGDLGAATQKEIVEETLAVLRHPDFFAVFGPGSLAEVPITGRLSSGDIVRGQIDRLLITDTDVFIVDYKTNRDIPEVGKAVPAAYLKQMKIYADVMEAIYPGRTCKAALLWTHGAVLMPVNVN